MDEQHATNFLAAFVRSNRYVFMIHALSGQKGHHHVNYQPSGYWLKRLRAIGFELDCRLTALARERAGGGYFENTGLVFVKSHSRLIAPVGAALALLALEWWTRRAVRYVRRHGLAVTARRLLVMRR